MSRHTDSSNKSSTSLKLRTGVGLCAIATLVFAIIAFRGGKQDDHEPAPPFVITPPTVNSPQTIDEEPTETESEEQEADAQREEEEERARRQRVYAVLDKRDAAEREKWTRVISRTAADVTIPNADPQSRPSSFVHAMEESEAVTREDVDFWSFRPLQQIVPPALDNDDWSSNPVDRFVLRKLREAGITPAPVAEHRELARRLSFDLLGLPPESADIDAFLADRSPAAYRQLVDRLLANPAFGERWGRVWLDLARYADSNGYEEDELRPQAFPYRDFVIWAMNSDLPYDSFVRWQVAGDELRPDIPLAVAATGFMTAGPYNTFLPQESERYDELDDMVSTLFTTTLGLTVGCARCHDHFYDPVPTRDYYGLVAIFKETRRYHSYLVEDQGRQYRRWADPVHQRRDEIKQIFKERLKEDNISDLDYFTEEEKNLLRQPVDPDNKRQARLISLCKRCLMIEDYQLDDDMEPLPRDRQRYTDLVAEIDELLPALGEKPPMGLTLAGSSTARVNILHRGSLKSKGVEVGPGFLTAVTRGRPIWNDDTWRQWRPIDATEGAPAPRSALAFWLTDTETGPGALLARVIVNRLWQHHFGDGLVRTPSDFGRQGDEPSHPELLEWLATELIENDWSLKHIHRLIVTSSTYRQATAANEQVAQVDPENRLFSRWMPRRLTAEMLWDSLLKAGDSYNRTMYGPGVRFPIPADVVFHTQKELEKTWPTDVETDRPALQRRAIYLLRKRTIPIPTLQLFDAPSAGFSCSRRKQTTVPTQMLALWHSPLVRRQARRLAQRVWQSTAEVATAAERRTAIVQEAFHITLQRQPTPSEIQLSNALLSDSDDEETHITEVANFCQVLFLSNEFSYVD